MLDEFIKILSDIVSFKSIAINHEECVAAASYLKELLKNYGFSVDLINVKDGNPVIFAEIPGEEKESLLFYNHYDIQPADPLDEWKSDPFRLTRKDNYLFGRGVGDNKGNIVSRILAVKKVLDEYEQLPYGVKFVIEGEEEAGSGHLWTALKMKREFFTNVFGVIWEFGGYGRDGSMALYLGLKGILYIELKAKRLSRDAHSASAVILPSAIWDLIDFIEDLRKNNFSQIEGFYRGIMDAREIINEIRTAGFEIAFDPKGIKEEFGIKEFLNNMSDEEALIAYFSNPTFNIDGIISGYIGEGQKTVLPKEARVKIDFRLPPYQDPYNISTKFCELAKKNNIECEVLSISEPAYTDFKHPFVQSLIKFLNNYGQEIKIAPWSPASGPMHYFTKNLGLPTVAGIGVSYWSSCHHAPNENIRIQDVERTINLLTKMLMDENLIVKSQIT